MGARTRNAEGRRADRSEFMLEAAILIFGAVRGKKRAARVGKLAGFDGRGEELWEMVS